MRPALVWGWTRYPSRSSATISERTVAEDTWTPGELATWEEPTGSAGPMYSVTTASRMAARRALRARASSATSVSGVESVGGVMGCLALKSTECQGRSSGRHRVCRHRGGHQPSVSVVTQAQRRDEGLLGHLDPADVLHLLLALFLLLEQLALAGDVAAVALGQHVLALGLDRLAGHDAPADGGLDRDVEHLARNELPQLLGHLAPVGVGRGPVHDGREGVDRCMVDEDVHPHQVARGVVLGLVVEAGVALGPALQLVEEVDDHLGQRKGVDELDPFGR